MELFGYTIFLKLLGYRVLTATTGTRALQLYQENRDAIDLVVLDMVMPDMRGGECFDRLRDLNPAARVLLASGYSIDGQARTILDRGCNGFIQSPSKLNTSQKRFERSWIFLNKSHNPASLPVGMKNFEKYFLSLT